MSSLGPKRYDAFLSYNSQDRPAVHELAERLKGERLELYLEAWELAPGWEFQPALAEALRDSRSCVVFLGPNGLGPWQKQELQVAIDTRARDEAYHVIPVLLPGTERPRRGDVAHLEFLINASWVEFLTTLDDERAFRSLVWGITGTKPPEPDKRYEGVCPYRGLEAFRPDDAKFFFGRANLTGWLVSALRREVRAAQGVRFLGVLGPSGSGKSSVVLAGLVPRLRAGAIEGSERWPVAILRPGDDPLKSLTEKVVPLLRQEVRPDPSLSESREQKELLADLRTDGEEAATELDRYIGLKFADEPEDRRLIIVVDQFEEVFTYRPQDDQARARFEQARAAFFANLLNAAAAPGGRVAVVLTMRSDFLSACAPFPQLAAVLSAHQELVGPMSAAELRAAIERPASLVGCEVEPPLTERLLADVEGQSGALPLMQFALTEVWKKRDVRRLTLRAYDELGKDAKGESRGIEGVLDHRANEIYRNLTPEGQDLCRRLFLRLVQPGERTEDTKRRVSYRELLPDDPARAEAVRKLVQTLASRDARLITTEGTDATDGAVEVAHEALIRGWTQFRQWVDAERTGLRIHRRLTEAAQEWAEARPEAKADFLYSRARLAVCREWVATHRDELNPIEGAFLAASEEAERRREQDALETERRLLEQERAVAEDKARRNRRLRRLNVLLVVASAFAVVFAVFAFKKSWQAKQNENTAKQNLNTAMSRQLSEQAMMLDGEPDLALLLSLQAFEYGGDTADARRGLLHALQVNERIKTFLPGPEGWGLRKDSGPCVAVSKDGKTLAAGWGGTIQLWDVSHTDAPPALLTVPEGRVFCLAFGPDGATLASGGGTVDKDGTVFLWEVAAGKAPRRPRALRDGHTDIVRGVDFSPDGKTLASGGWDHEVKFWDVAGGRLKPAAGPARGHFEAVRGVAFSPDGKTLASGGADNRVLLWDAAAGTPFPNDVVKPLLHQESVTAVAFSPDGSKLASADGLGQVRFWDAAAKFKPLGHPVDVSGVHNQVLSIAFNHDGSRLAVAGTDKRITLVDPESRKTVGDPLSGHTDKVFGLAFAPDDNALLASCGADGKVILWSVASGRPAGGPPYPKLAGIDPPYKAVSSGS